MARTSTYEHFCPVARTLEVIGEKWSLLIVRDLLRGPQRFTDLQRTLGPITPKWLTQRLRDLEEAGIVQRESVEGRREVWYRLTRKGRDLAPVIRSLNVWGVRHALRPLREGEAARPGQMIFSITDYLDATRHRLSRPKTWEFRFAGGLVYSIRFDGRTWSFTAEEAESPDLRIETTEQEWARVLTGSGEDLLRELEGVAVTGDDESRAEFREVFSRGEGVPA